jgi:hypothetical protein
MGHIRLGILPQSKQWRAVVDLLGGDADLPEIAEAAARASGSDLKRASSDPLFQFVSSLLVQLPLWARAPGFDEALRGIGADPVSAGTITGLLTELSGAIDAEAFHSGRASDAGALAKAALLESLSVQLHARVPSLFDPSPQDVRSALGALSQGKNFALLARDFFARLTYRSLDYYLSRELAVHTGQEKRFATDADRVAFQNDLAQHTFEASRIVEEFAAGWYGKTVWQKQQLDQEAINKFTAYAFKKLRGELGRRRANV